MKSPVMYLLGVIQDTSKIVTLGEIEADEVADKMRSDLCARKCGRIVRSHKTRDTLLQLFPANAGLSLFLISKRKASRSRMRK